MTTWLLLWNRAKLKYTTQYNEIVSGKTQLEVGLVISGKIALCVGYIQNTRMCEAHDKDGKKK